MEATLAMGSVLASGERRKCWPLPSARYFPASLPGRHGLGLRLGGVDGGLGDVGHGALLAGYGTAGPQRGSPGIVQSVRMLRLPMGGSLPGADSPGDRFFPGPHGPPRPAV